VANRPRLQVKQRTRTTRLVVMAVPCLAPLVRQETADAGLSVEGAGSDGRSDVLLLEADRGRRSAALRLRTTEDVFVEVGRASRSASDDPHALARRMWRPEAVERALSVWLRRFSRWPRPWRTA
jgi:hypothetical protein